MKKPDAVFYRRGKCRLWIDSFLLQMWGMVLKKLTGRKITAAFYYSKTQKDWDNFYFSLFQNIKQPAPTFFGGEEYTEMRGLEAGWCNQPDCKLIGFGSDKDVR